MCAVPSCTTCASAAASRPASRKSCLRAPRRHRPARHERHQPFALLSGLISGNHRKWASHTKVPPAWSSLTCWPSTTSIWSITPASSASTGISIFIDSTVTITSPTATCAPGCTCTLAMTPETVVWIVLMDRYLRFQCERMRPARAPAQGITTASTSTGAAVRDTSTGLASIDENAPCCCTNHWPSVTSMAARACRSTAGSPRLPPKPPATPAPQRRNPRQRLRPGERRQQKLHVLVSLHQHPAMSDHHDRPEGRVPMRAHGQFEIAARLLGHEQAAEVGAQAIEHGLVVAPGRVRLLRRGYAEPHQAVL